ncbi:integrase [Pseudomonas fluorescens]|uniref:Integrase n=1 Tax=Pseudomonas fluorescens TaxID=294 RepID=A0A423MC45_PSEFL|nr:integrase [Pseudomonas fluorescens]
MSNMNPAFIAQQLGHSVQMLLTTYARWLNSSSDWGELEKLQIGIKIGIRQKKPALTH